VLPFTLPAPTAQGFTGQNPPIWANFLAIANGASSLNAIISAINALPTPPLSLFDHFASVTTSGVAVTTLYSDTIAAGQLANNGDKLHAWYAGTMSVTNTGNRDWFLSFGGTTIFDTGGVGNSQNGSWFMNAEIIRESSTVVRCSVSSIASRGTTVTVYSLTNFTRITGLTLSNTQALVLSGQASVAGNDITAAMGFVQFIPA
jgi:hypothetical protein